MARKGCNAIEEKNESLYGCHSVYEWGCPVLAHYANVRGKEPVSA